MCGLSEAVFAEAALFDVDVLHGVRRSHDAAEIVAMSQVKCVSQLMHRLGQQAVGEQVEVGRQSVKLLGESIPALLATGKRLPATP